MQIKPTTIPAKEVSQTKQPETAQPKLSAYEQGKKMQDVAILSAVANQNSSADNPMKLLYKTAIEEINKQLEPTLGDNAVQSAYETDVDVSPEATAERIVNASTAFYQAFKDQNPDLTDDESLTQFLDVIGTGIDKGFADAKDILESLNVLEGDIETNIDSTYSLVQEGLTSFKDLILERLADNIDTEGVNDENNNSIDKNPLEVN